MSIDEQTGFFHAIRSTTSIWVKGWTSWVTFCILWVICWLTIILGPPATFALVYAGRLSVLEVMPGLSELVSAARRSFGLAWLWMGLNLLAGGGYSIWD
ncbi:MAG: hypothetical protein M1281_13215 [Chloroflexi bacterium]|nr:hypothetical protein [Chloroflexota bacterium]